MSKILQVFAYELQRNIRRIGFLVATLGLPMIALVSMFGFHIYQQTRSDEPNPLLELDFEGIKKAAIVDLSGAFDSVPEALDGILIPYVDEVSAREALRADEVDVFYVIQPDYLESGEVVLHLPNLAVNLMTSAPIEQLFYATMGGNLDNATIQRLRNPMNVKEFNLEDVQEDGSTEASQGLEYGIVYAFTMLFFVGLLMTNTYLMQSVIEERESRLIEILLSTMNPMQLLTGKIFALGVLGLSQLLFWGLSMGFIGYLATRISTYSILLSTVSIDLRWDIVPLMLIYFVLMYMTFAAVFAGIGAISGSAQEGQQYIGLLVMPTIVPFYLFPVIQADPNGSLAIGLSMIPITSSITVLMRSIMIPVPLWQLTLSIGIMILTAAGAIWLSGRLFRVQTLLAGSFKLKDVPKLIFSDVIPRQVAKSES